MKVNRLSQLYKEFQVNYNETVHYPQCLSEEGGNGMEEKRSGGVKLKYANIILGACFIVLALAILFICQKDGMKFYVKRAPGPGFMPALAAALIGICGIGITVQGVLRLKKEDPEGDGPLATGMEWRNYLLVIGVSAAAVFFAEYIGLITAITLGVIVLIRFLGPEPWKTAIPVGIGTGAVMYLIFVVLLKVHVPVGPLGF